MLMFLCIHIGAPYFDNALGKILSYLFLINSKQIISYSKVKSLM